jgi:hypothetical protein
MSSDVERLLEAPEPATASDDNTNKGRSGIWNYVYLYKMPQLTQEQLIGFSTKYKVFNELPRFTLTSNGSLCSNLSSRSLLI